MALRIDESTGTPGLSARHLANDGEGPSQSGFNLLRINAVHALVQWGGFPYVFQAIVLAVLIALASIGWGHYTPAGVPPKLYAKTNLVNLLIWGLWWPSIVLGTILLGRAWCIVCPLELVSNVSERLGRRLGVRQRPLGGWLARGSLVILLFALLQMLVPGVQIHRVPHYTSIFLLLSLGTAFLVGLLMKNRAFCRGFCPVALLLNGYGRGGALAVRAGSAHACLCNDHGCRSESERTRLDRRSCPSLLNPPKLTSNRDCLVCGQCLKSCGNDTMQLLLRPPFSSADQREKLASWPLTLFVMVVSGFVTYELTGVWKASEPVFLWVPKQLTTLLGAGAVAGGWIQGLWTIILVPLVIWLVLGFLVRLQNGASTLPDAWRRLVLPVAVIVGAGHVCKGFEKFTSWVGYLPYAWREPTGVANALAMQNKTIAMPAPWLSLSGLSLLAIVVMAVAAFLAIREARLADPRGYASKVASISLLGAFYLFLVFGWGGWTG